MRPLVSLAVVSSFVAASVAGMVGCSHDPDAAPDYEVGEGDVNGQPSADAPPAQPDPNEEPVRPANDDPVDPEPSADDVAVDDDGGAPMDAGDAGTKSDAGPTTITKSCTSTYGSQKSVSQLTWVVSGSNAIMKSLYVTVTNVYHRNLNDVDIWVKYPNRTEYLAFNSGDILTSGRKVAVKLPTNWTKPIGTRIRVETNFDQSGADPSASCSFTLSKQ